MSLRIGIDARLVNYRRGIGNFVYHLLEGIANKDLPHTFYVYVDSDDSAAAVPAARNFVTRVLKPRVEPVWEQLRLPFAVWRDRLDVLHSTAITAPLFLPRRTRLIASLHDVMYLHSTSELPRSPSRRQRLGRLYRRLIVPSVSRIAAHIMTISQFSKEDIVRTLGTNERKITVVHLAASPSFRVEPVLPPPVIDGHPIERPFVFVLGAVDPRKNTSTAIQAFARARHVLKGVQLVIAGLPQSDQNRFRAVAQEAGVSADTVFLGFTDESTLVALYQSAEVFLYPSLYEGFGIPIVEAMSCGTPVITSKTSSMPEISAGATVMVDPSSVEEIAEALQRLLMDKGLRARLRKEGLERAMDFSWGRVVEQVLALYDRVALQSR